MRRLTSKHKSVNATRRLLNQEIKSILQNGKRGSSPSIDTKAATVKNELADDHSTIQRPTRNSMDDHEGHLVIDDVSPIAAPGPLQGHQHHRTMDSQNHFEEVISGTDAGPMTSNQ